MGPMGKFFAANIDRKGRIARLLMGLGLIAAGIFVWRLNLWVAAGLLLSGAFGLYEAARGWCLMRACGIRTKL